MAFTKKVWEKVSGFDETFDGTYGWEDIDFGIRSTMQVRSSDWLQNVGTQVRDAAHRNTFDDRKVPSTIDSGTSSG